MCGIVGMVGNAPVNQRLYDALTVLQHRGQDAAGIVTSSDGELYVRKGAGLVRDVFQQHHMVELKGNIGIGHVRYPTAGGDRVCEAQPFYVNAPYGICLAHNGNLTNAAELAAILIREDRRHLNTSSDSEVLLNVFASELQRVGAQRITAVDVWCSGGATARAARSGCSPRRASRCRRWGSSSSAISHLARACSSTKRDGCTRSSSARTCVTRPASLSTSILRDRTRSSTGFPCIALA